MSVSQGQITGRLQPLFSVGFPEACDWETGSWARWALGLIQQDSSNCVSSYSPSVLPIFSFRCCSDAVYHLHWLCKNVCALLPVPAQASAFVPSQFHHDYAVCWVDEVSARCPSWNMAMVLHYTYHYKLKEKSFVDLQFHKPVISVTSLSLQPLISPVPSFETIGVISKSVFFTLYKL